MIIMHSRKLIFIRCRKTASTSLEIELSRHAEQGDVLTGLSPRDERLRALHGGRCPSLPPNGFYNHMPAIEVRALTPSWVWDSYFKFCIERNPWDKVVSMFYHRRGRPAAAQTFKEFITSGEFNEAANHPLYCDGGTVIVDKVGKFERLDSELKGIFGRVGLSYTGLSCRAKSQFREAEGYRSLYDACSREAVATAFAKEISLHDYQF